MNQWTNLDACKCLPIDHWGPWWKISENRFNMGHLGRRVMKTCCHLNLLVSLQCTCMMCVSVHVLYQCRRQQNRIVAWQIYCSLQVWEPDEKLPSLPWWETLCRREEVRVHPWPGHGRPHHALHRDKGGRVHPFFSSLSFKSIVLKLWIWNFIAVLTI